MERYRGIRRVPEKGKVEGFDVDRWISSLSSVLDILFHEYPHELELVKDRRTGIEIANKRFQLRPTESFLRNGLSERFYDDFGKDVVEGRRLRGGLYENLAALPGYLNVFTYLANTQNKLIPVFPDTKMEDEPNATMMQVAPTFIRIFHDGDTANPDPHEEEIVVRELKLLMQDFSDVDKFYPCVLEFAEIHKEGGQVVKEQCKIHFPNQVPSIEEGPDPLDHLESRHFGILAAILHDVHQFSVENRGVIEARWNGYKKRAVVLQGTKPVDPRFYLPHVIQAVVNEGEK